MSVTLEIERAIRWRCDWMRVLLLPEAPVRIPVTHTWFAGTPREHQHQGFTDYMADFVSVSEAGYVTELEVKVSRDDWRVDLKKPKWNVFPPYINRFIYVVPEELGIPDWVPPVAGVWHLYSEQSNDPTYARTLIKIARQPKRLGREKVPEKILANWRRTFYYRFWRLREDLDHRIERKRRRMGADLAQARCFC